MEIQVSSIDDLPRAAQLFLEELNNRKVVAFSAEMGAGKTTFITAILHAMGITDVDGSPTYSLVNVYEIPMYGKIYHFDLYRINDETEALDIGIDEMLYGGGVCFIEWPEKIEHLLPDNTIWSYIRRNDDDTRTIILDV